MEKTCVFVLLPTLFYLFAGEVAGAKNNGTVDTPSPYQSFKKELRTARKELKHLQKQIINAKEQLTEMNTELQAGKTAKTKESASPFRCESGVQNSPYLTSTAPSYVTVKFKTVFSVAPQVTIGTRFAGDWHNALPIVINTWVQGSPSKRQFTAGFQTATGSPGAYISISWFACGN